MFRFKTMKKSVRLYPQVQMRSRIPLSSPWLVVLLAALLLLIANINFNTFGVFFKPILKEFGWSRSEVSGALAIRSLVAGAAALPMGYLADRYGPRRVLLLCFICLGAGLLLTGTISNLWQLYLVQVVLLGLGTSAPFVCVMSTVTKWHTQKPGFALGITATGTGLSTVLFPPLATALIESTGWREAMTILGLITITVAVPAALFFRDPPSFRRQSGDKDRRSGSPFAVWRMLPGLLKDRAFLAIAASFFLFYVACNLLLVHLVNYLTDIGISPLTAATMVSVMGMVGTIGRLGMGIISDRIGIKVDTAVCCTSVILSLLTLMLKIPHLMWVSVALFGIGFGGMSPLLPATVLDHFGWQRLSTLIGAVLLWNNLGAALGSWMGSAIFDASGSYFWALVLSTIFTIFSLGTMLRTSSAREAEKSGAHDLGRSC